MSAGYDGFFIGWNKKWPKGLTPFLIGITMALLGLFAGAAYSIATTQNDGGIGSFSGRVKLTGVLASTPYPHLRVLPGEQYPKGHTVMLTGGGKFGVQKNASAMDGSVVQVRGALLKRGALDMVQVGGAMRPAKDRVPDGFLKSESLGRWKLTGEICDGKCYTGAMRPGNGLAHRACANLCLIGGVPPVFVSTAPVAGSTFFMMADKVGNPVTQRLLDYTALMIDVEGEIEKRGDLLVFKIDPDSMRVR